MHAMCPAIEQIVDCANLQLFSPIFISMHKSSKLNKGPSARFHVLAGGTHCVCTLPWKKHCKKPDPCGGRSLPIHQMRPFVCCTACFCSRADAQKWFQVLRTQYCRRLELATKNGPFSVGPMSQRKCCDIASLTLVVRRILRQGGRHISIVTISPPARTGMPCGLMRSLSPHSHALGQVGRHACQHLVSNLKQPNLSTDTVQRGR
jgi:hypothetical protein